MEKHVYFVRHGESESNAAGVMLGAKAMLTEKGRKEAEIVAERIARIGIDTLIASPYPRTMDTARHIADRVHLPVEPVEHFREWRRASHQMGKSWRDDPAMDRFLDDLLSRYAERDDHRHSDEENFADLKARAVAALAFLEDLPAKRVCVVTHGTFLQILFGVVVFGEAFSGAHWKHMFHHVRMSNTGITLIKRDPKHGWFVNTWNDSAHLG